MHATILNSAGNGAPTALTKAMAKAAAEAKRTQTAADHKKAERDQLPL